jgi:hypothetical protein
MKLLVSIWEILTRVAIIVLPIIALYRDWKHPNRRTKAYHRLTLAIIAFSALAGISLLVFELYERQEKERAEKWITGSTMFPVVLGSTPFVNDKILVFQAKNNDQFPVYNLSYRVTNGNLTTATTLAKNLPNTPGVIIPVPMQENEWDLYQSKLFTLGTLGAHEWRRFYDIDSTTIPGKWQGVDYVFTFDVKTSNGWGSQTMSWIRQGDKLVNKSTIIHRIKDGDMMEQNVSSDDFADKKAWDYGPIPMLSSGSRWHSNAPPTKTQMISKFLHEIFSKFRPASSKNPTPTPQPSLNQSQVNS